MQDELVFQAPDAFAHAVDIVPIKPPRHGTRRHQLVVMPSRKNGCNLRMLPLLVDFCVMLERQPDVSCYSPTPYTLIHRGRQIRYSPSICAYGEHTGLVFFDIAQCNHPARDLRCALLRDWFDEMGYLFYPCYLADYPRGEEQRQYRYLYQYSFASTADGINSARAILQARGRMTVQELLEAGVEFCDVAAVLFTGEAKADLRFPVRRSTVVVTGGQSDEH